jgi:hypothetical protein
LELRGLIAYNFQCDRHGDGQVQQGLSAASTSRILFLRSGAADKRYSLAIQFMVSIFGILCFTYPLWGLFLLDAFCKKFATHGTIGERCARAVIVGISGTMIFTPVAIGTEGFGALAPWPAYFAAPKNSFFMGELAIFVFVLGFVGTLLASSNGKKHKAEPN